MKNKQNAVLNVLIRIVEECEIYEKSFVQQWRKYIWNDEIQKLESHYN